MHVIIGDSPIALYPNTKATLWRQGQATMIIIDKAGNIIVESKTLSYNVVENTVDRVMLSPHDKL